MNSKADQEIKNNWITKEKQLEEKLPEISLSANIISLNLLDVASTIPVMRSEFGREGNPLISLFINTISIQYTMALKLFIILICLVGIWKFAKNHRTIIFVGLMILNVLYIVVVLNNIYALQGLS